MLKKTGSKPYWLIGITIAVLGTNARSESYGGIVTAAAWQKRLFLKAAESFVDAITRLVVSSAAAPADREEYVVSSELIEYGDDFTGTLRGTDVPRRVRLTWRDAISDQVCYETRVNGVLQDRDPFYYIPNNRDYSCTQTSNGTTVSTYNVRAHCAYRVRNKVVRSSPANAVYYHPVRYVFDLTTLPSSCWDTRNTVLLRETGTVSVPRDGSVRCSPLWNNADVNACLVMYEPK